jgi:quercetin dioxygenase-like cupin family protein
MLSADTEVRPGIFATTQDTEQLTVTVYRYEPGCEWETHQHPEDQVTYVTEGGTVDFVVDGRPTPLSAGELAIIPGGVLHSASVPADGERVITLNVWRLRR